MNYFNHLTVVLAIFCISNVAFASEPSDSIETSVQLEGIVVHGQTDYTKADKIVFKPTESQKKSSQNLIDLIRNSGFTNITVDPLSGNSVKTLLNEDVELYINYVKAETADIEGVKTDDIKRIEYLDYPADARFRGKKHVMNIILYPQSGGYTKIRPGVKINPFEVAPQIYSKYNIRNFSFDIFTQYYYSAPHDNGVSEISNFNLTDRILATVTREQQFISSKGRETLVPVTFRMSYSNNKISIRNAFGYVFSKKRDTALENVILSTNLNQQNMAESFLSKKGNEASWNGEYSFLMNHGFQLSIGTIIDYSHNNNINHYTTDNTSSLIGYNAYDNVFLGGIEANLLKEITSGHYVGFNGAEYYRLYNTHFTNPAKFDRQYLNYVTASINYSFNKNKVASRLSLGIASTEQKSTDFNKIKDNLFVYDLSINWSPNSKNYFNLVSRLDNFAADANRKSNVLVRQNELLWKQGNSDLKSGYIWINSLSYTIMANSWLTLSASAKNSLYTNRDIICYRLLDNEGGVVETYSNSGNYNVFNVVANVGGRFFNNSLQINLSGQYNHLESTGLYKFKKDYFTGMAYASYFIKNFYISAYFASRQIRELYSSPEISRHYPDYRFDFGWSKYNLNLKLTMFNPFRKTKASYVSSVTTPVYSYSKTYYNTMAYRAVMFSISYTFSYGKKISQQDEIGIMRNNGSAIY